jgi:hypothetical protein
MTARHRQSRSGRLWRSDAIVPWIPMLVGVAIMAGYVLYGVALQVGDRSPAEPTFAVPERQSPSPSPSVTVTATGTPGPDGVEVAVRLARAAPPEVSPTPPPPPPSPSPSPAGVPELVGEYKLRAVFDDSFIGKVVITNPAAQAQDWTVELGYSSDVGELKAFWVDGAAQPTVRRSDEGYVFTSSEPVEAGAQVVLKAHFAFRGRDIDPTTCTVNGEVCVR